MGTKARMVTIGACRPMSDDDEARGWRPGCRPGAVEATPMTVLEQSGPSAPPSGPCPSLVSASVRPDWACHDPLLSGVLRRSCSLAGRRVRPGGPQPSMLLMTCLMRV